MEAAVRDNGAVPAAVAVVDGRVRVGLDGEAVERLSHGGAVKAGLADLPAVLAGGRDAGTTVGATLWAAHAVGVGVFATGGIGGVHRGAAETFDISGDLAALARFPGCVISSGAKAVLDLPKTRELLETLGVCVLGYRTGTFPAFVSPGSGLTVRHRVDGPEEAAAVVRARDALGLAQAVLVLNPPPEEEAVPWSLLEEEIAGVCAETAGAGIRGGEVTPRLLESLNRRTRGASLKANRALLVANAALGARIACSLAEARGRGA